MNYRKLFETTALVPPPPPEIEAMTNAVMGDAADKAVREAVFHGEAMYWISPDRRLFVVSRDQWRDIAGDSE